MTSMLIPFHDEMTGLIGEERALDIVCPAFHKAFDTFPNKILIDKLIKYRLDEQVAK